MEAKLKTLIIHQIRAVYGSVKVYDEPIRQGLTTPAFLVLIVEDGQERKFGRMSEWDFMVNVTYFPADERNAYSENDKVSQKFKENFRHIGNEFHVNKLRASKSDGVLVINFTVRKLVFKAENGTVMRDIDYGGVTLE